MIYFRKIISTTIFSLLGILCMAQNTQPTQIMVRAKAKDAKFIGTSIGGALVTITDKATGELLAKGEIAGSTGNTQKLMKEPHQRRVPLADEVSAGYLAVINLAQPTYVVIAVQAPSAKRQATALVTTETWIVPGKHILGDGIVLEVPGFVVDVLSPRTHSTTPAKFSVELSANVVMMCGCPIAKGGIWDADKMEVAAWIYKEGVFMREVEMSFVETNLFKAEVEGLVPGSYSVVVYGYDPVTGNTGVDKTTFLVGE